MRIIGGESRGRILKMPKGVGVRPTQDRVREAIFNIIKEKIPGSSILDLYAGSGAFGIEALSRGALFSIFVDDNTKCINTIKSNLLVLGDKAESSQVLRMNAVKAISELQKENKKFDIVFLDPPYHREIAKNILLKIEACDILSQNSFIIVEHFKKDLIPKETAMLLSFKEKSYGDTAVSLYRKK